jgi:hypothetical protein
MSDYPGYRDDDLNKKDTGLIVKRYVLALKQLGMPVPDDLPFKSYLPLMQNDTTVDPFDAIEMIGVSPDSSKPGDPGGPKLAPAPTPAPGDAGKDAKAKQDEKAKTADEKTPPKK